MNTLTVTDEEHATILAALRFYQMKGQGDPFNRSDGIQDIATNGDRLTSLDHDEIDTLCEKINFETRPLQLEKEGRYFYLKYGANRILYTIQVWHRQYHGYNAPDKGVAVTPSGQMMSFVKKHWKYSFICTPKDLLYMLEPLCNTSELKETLKEYGWEV